MLDVYLICSRSTSTDLEIKAIVKADCYLDVFVKITTAKANKQIKAE